MNNNPNSGTNTSELWNEFQKLRHTGFGWDLWCLGLFGSPTELGWSIVFFSEILNLLLLRRPLKLIGLFAKTFWWKSSSKIETSSGESASSPSASSASVSLSSLFLPVLLPWELLREVFDSTLKKNKKLFFQHYIMTKTNAQENHENVISRWFVSFDFLRKEKSILSFSACATSLGTASGSFRFDTEKSREIKFFFNITF